MAADPRIVAALTRFYTTAEVGVAYEAALAAYVARETEVTIESVTGEGGSSSGRLIGDPGMIMEACEEVLAAAEAVSADTGALVPGTTHVDFSKRYIGT